MPDAPAGFDPGPDPNFGRRRKLGEPAPPLKYPTTCRLRQVEHHWYHADHSSVTFEIEEDRLSKDAVRDFHHLFCDASKFGDDPVSLFLRNLTPKGQTVIVTATAWEFPDQGMVVETVNDSAPWPRDVRFIGRHRYPKFMHSPIRPWEIDEDDDTELAEDLTNDNADPA